MTDAHEIEQLFDRYAAAVDAKDVDAFAELFDDDVRVFDMWEVWAYDGVDAWRETAREWLASLGDESVAVAFEDVRVASEGAMAVAHAFVRFAGVAATGEELRSMQNRLTWALRRTPRGWKIVHQHTSAPLDETAKAIFRR